MTVASLKQVNAIIRDRRVEWQPLPIYSHLSVRWRGYAKCRVSIWNIEWNSSRGMCYCYILWAEGRFYFHTISWHSRKQTRVASFSGSAEAIASISSFAAALHVQEVFANIFQHKLPITLAVDSKSLHQTLGTHHQPRDSSVNSRFHQLSLDYMSGLLN